MLHPLVPFAARIDVWKPIAPTVGELKNESWDHGVLLRMPERGNLEAGRKRLDAILLDMVQAQMPGLESKATIRLVPIREIYAGRVRLRLLLILCAATLLLLTAGVSLTNLFLSRVASRAREFATRMALGAGRMRIFGQALTETALVSVAGGLLASVLAYYGALVLARLGPDDVRLLADTAFNLPLIVFSLGASIATGLACGIAPAWRASRHDSSTDLHDAARSTVGDGLRAGRAHQLLVGVEMALGTLLLASAALLLHSFANVMRADRGYQVDRILAVDVSLFGDRYATGARRVAFYRDLVANVRTLAGVEAAGAISDLPAMAGYADNTGSRTLFLESDTNFRSQVLKRPVAMIRSVTTGYFSASGSPITAGRVFADDEPTLAAMVSESLARRLWPGESPALAVGRSFRQGDVRGPLISIVGVVRDAQPGGVDREAPLTLYRPYPQWASGPMTLVVRTVDEPTVIAPAVRAEIRRLDPALPISAVRPLREIVAATVGPRRFQTVLTSVFSAVALVLGAVGLYGVVSYAVERRTREIGLRIALGALRIDVLRWVLTSGMQPVLGGLVVGLAAAIAAARTLRSLLYGVSPVDPPALGAVVIVLLSASGLACYLPARRAAALDPTIALRHE
jgi:predicted permease